MGVGMGMGMGVRMSSRRKEPPVVGLLLIELCSVVPSSLSQP